MIGNELQLNIVELKKADRLGHLSGPTGAWVSFFEHWQEDVIMADISHEPVKQAMNRIRQLSAEEEAQRLAFVRERGLRDWNHTIRSARREGREEGREEGRQEGREEGVAIGRTQALRDTLGLVLAQRFGPLTESTETQLAAAGPEQLVHWISRVMAADSLDEVLSSSPDA